MAINLDLTSVTSGYNLTGIQANFAAVDAALADALSRSGGTPNTMETLLDMNGYDIINVGSFNVEALVVDGNHINVDSLSVVTLGYKGDWTDVTAYALNDVVANNGSSYICKLAHTSSSTTEAGVGASEDTYWQLLSAIGPTGATGATGASGAGSGDLVAASNLSDVANIATARDNLGLTIGTNVQAYNAKLADIAGLSPTADQYIQWNGTNFISAGVSGLSLSRAANVKEFGSSGTWTAPADLLVTAVLIGAGASGGRGASGDEASGGGAGAVCIKTFNVSSGDVLDFTRGDKGPSIASNGDGVDGGDSTLTSADIPSLNMNAGGGKAGLKGSTGVLGGVGGIATGGDFNYQGGDGGAVTGNNSASGGGGVNILGEKSYYDAEDVSTTTTAGDHAPTSLPTFISSHPLNIPISNTTAGDNFVGGVGTISSGQPVHGGIGAGGGGARGVSSGNGGNGYLFLFY